jgi:hypothetical protein
LSSRITRLEDGQCIIGMRKIAMIPLITFDILVNVRGLFPFQIGLSNLTSFLLDILDHPFFDPTTKSVVPLIPTYSNNQTDDPGLDLYGFRNVQRNASTERLRTVAMRTFIGALSTTVSSVV